MKKQKHLVIPILILYLLCLRVIVGLYLADVQYTKSLDLVKESRWDQAEMAADKALAFNPLEPAYYRGRAKVFLTNITNLENEEEVDMAKTRILADLETAYELNPNNLATIRNSIPLYYFLAVKSLHEPPTSQNVDRRFLPYTRGFFNKVKYILPNDVGVFVLLAKYEKRLGLEPEYQASIDQIKQLRPDLLQWHHNFTEPSL